MIVRDVAVPRIGKDKVRSYEGKSKDPRNFDYVIVGSWLIERDGDYTEREKKVIKFAERESDEICDLIDKSVGRKSKYAKHVIILNPGRYEDLRTLVEDMGDDKQKTKMVWAPELTSQGLARIRTSRDLPAYCQELVARESEYAFLYIELARFGKTRPGVLRTDKTYDKFFFRRIGNIWDLEKLFIKWRDFYTFRNEKDELFDFSEERFKSIVQRQN